MFCLLCLANTIYIEWYYFSMIFKLCTEIYSIINSILMCMLIKCVASYISLRTNHNMLFNVIWLYDEGSNYNFFNVKSGNAFNFYSLKQKAHKVFNIIYNI